MDSVETPETETRWWKRTRHTEADLERLLEHMAIVQKRLDVQFFMHFIKERPGLSEEQKNALWEALGVMLNIFSAESKQAA